MKCCPLPPHAPAPSWLDSCTSKYGMSSRAGFDGIISEPGVYEMLSITILHINSVLAGLLHQQVWDEHRKGFNRV